MKFPVTRAAELEPGRTLITESGDRLLVTRVDRMFTLVEVQTVDVDSVREVSEYGWFTVEQFAEPILVLDADELVAVST